MTEQMNEWTFALVDLAGFTALTETHGDERAADLAVEFAQMAEARLGAGDRLVKTIGDAVLLASTHPEASLTLVQRLLADAYQTEGLPVSRAGLHHGPAVERDQDLFGAAVNLTARVASQAAGGQVLATSVVAEAAASMGIETSSLGGFTLRNVAEPVELWEIALVEAPSASSIDPVCRMNVDHAKAAGRLHFANRDYWFCSMECVSAFAASPEQYVH